MQDHYDQAFYEHQREESLKSGLAILPHILELFPVSSLVDFGCGMGTWLAAARRLGVERTVGVEGEWVTQDRLLDPEVELLTRNLETSPEVDGRFDLAMSLEVAEHLSPERADSFVNDLCSRSSRVFFSAAVPGQGGAHHVNEQWPDWWAGLFASRGYRPIDVIRPRVWSDDSLPIHYRQNAFLYIHDSEFNTVARKAGRENEPLAFPMNAVHPALYRRNTDALDREPNIRRRLQLTLGLPGALLRAAGRRLGS